ncbi:MAG TPA: dicarboxylate/amino acid:cation symporter, partial [Hyphomonadaceae bacterium]|nr:dicarboxylate/amino acid:cation symporter [Hyphomonadaceae bacterium]
MQRALFIALIIAMIAGIVVGAIIHGSVSTAMAAEIAGYIKIGSDIFLRMIKMIIAPLILTTLSAGIAHVGGGAALGRIGARTMAWFITASFVSLALGLLIATLLAPGAGFDPTGLVDEAPKLATAAFSLREFLSHVFPTSFIEAMAKNEVLQIVVFSLFLGTALQAMGPKAKLVTELLEQGGHVMLKITGYVMTFAPVAVFAALAAVVATQGLGVLVDYGRLVGSFYIGLLILWALLVGAGFVVLGPSVGKLIGSLRDPLVLAFATASSEAAYPRVLAKVEEYGVANRVASFVLPLGYSFNLDG